MALSATQLPLGLNVKDQYQFANFYFAQLEIKQALFEFLSSSSNFIYIWGEQATGKSHLLLALIELARAEQKQVLYLPLAELVDSATPDILQDVEQIGLLCIDDLDAIAGRDDWQEALFHCINRLQQSNCKWVISSQMNPAMIAVTLADLRSRLATALVYQLAKLNDADKQQALILQAQTRGLNLPVDVAQYLLRHHSRDMHELMALLKQLDKASMIEQRRLTIPFVRTFLNA